MRTSMRLLALKKWTYDRVCRGREMKTPARDADGNEDIMVIARQEPKVFLGWNPTRPDGMGILRVDPMNVCPGILIAPYNSDVRNTEPKRFDRYDNIRRPRELGQTLNVSVLFSVYEPGTRLPGFLQSAEGQEGLDMGRFLEGTEEGLFTLMDWIDDFKNALVAEKNIPNSDLMADEMSMTYSPYLEGQYIADKRPLYYGFVNVKFQCYAGESSNNTINKLLL